MRPRVSRKTDFVAHIRRIVGAQIAGVFDEMEKESPLSAVLRARDAAQAANADLLIAVGAGSVIQATRVVVHTARRDRARRAARHPISRAWAAVSPKLLAPKLPIINVLTAATSAQNRAGSAVKNPELDHRMEFFDPKTRPVAVSGTPMHCSPAPPGLR